MPFWVILLVVLLAIFLPYLTEGMGCLPSLLLLLLCLLLYLLYLLFRR